MPDLIIRPISSKKPMGKQRLQVRYHESVGGTAEYDNIAEITFEMARTIASCGEAYFLFGDPYKKLSEVQTEPDMNDIYLLVKRGLYYKPNSAGYVGVKELAGHYSKENAEEACRKCDGVTMMTYDEAPEYSPQCYEDIKLRHIRKKAAMGL